MLPSAVALDLHVDSATALCRALALPRPMVFTSGVFDLLHAGHVRLLEQAGRLGASLVVGVNADASARQLGKGTERPVQPQQDRLALVAALRAVSAALLFHELRPTALIDVLRPELYVKGGDVTLDSLPEARQVLAWGGRAIVLPLLAGRSTAVLVERIRGGTAAGRHAA